MTDAHRAYRAHRLRRRSERRAIVNPGLAALVCLGWYVLFTSVSLWAVSLQSDAAPRECDNSSCFSDRGEWTFFALGIGLPGLFVSLIISLLVLGLLAAKTRIGSATLLGSVAAVPVLLPVGWLMAAILR